MVAPAGENPRPHDSYAALAVGIRNVSARDRYFSGVWKPAEPRPRKSVAAWRIRSFQKRSFPFQLRRGFSSSEPDGPQL